VTFQYSVPRLWGVVEGKSGGEKRMSEANILMQLRAAAHPLMGAVADYDPLLPLLKKAYVVLL
jgi:hypothetical protein